MQTLTSYPWERSGQPRVTLRTVAAATSLCIAAAGAAHAQVAQNVLYNFTGGADGTGPSGALLADTTGPASALRGLYGATWLGGSSTCSYGCGSLFKVTPPKDGGTAWRETTLADFTGDGHPAGGLFSEAHRITTKTPLFGTTSGYFSTSEYGTVWSLVGKTLTTIYSFTGGADGKDPYNGNVVADKTGALYTTTNEGGNDQDDIGCGTVVKLTPPSQGQTAWTETTIWTFGNVSYDINCAPNGLVMDASGALYGTSQYGDPNGSVYKLTPPVRGQDGWTIETLYSFKSAQDGSYPATRLTFGKGGVLYGTTPAGGVNNQGVVFEVMPSEKGKHGPRGRTIWHFTGGTDGGLPMGPLLIDRNGAIYGTTITGGGSNSYGTVFKLTPPVKGQSEWSETTLWSFSNVSDGIEPFGLVADKTGTLYGGTGGGGSAGYGVIYSLTGTGFAP